MGIQIDETFEAFLGRQITRRESMPITARAAAVAAVVGVGVVAAVVRAGVFAGAAIAFVDAAAANIAEAFATEAAFVGAYFWATTER